MYTVYVAGPMTGHPSFNIPAFDAMAGRLRRLGFNAISPAELDDPETRAISMASPNGDIATLETHGQTWGDFLARDVKLLTDGAESDFGYLTEVDAIVVLPGWEKSRGARLETFVANGLHGKPVYYFKSDITPYLSVVPKLDLVRAWSGVADLRFSTPAPSGPDIYLCVLCNVVHEAFGRPEQVV